MVSVFQNKSCSKLFLNKAECVPFLFLWLQKLLIVPVTFTDCELNIWTCGSPIISLFFVSKDKSGKITQLSYLKHEIKAIVCCLWFCDHMETYFCRNCLQNWVSYSLWTWIIYWQCESPLGRKERLKICISWIEVILYDKISLKFKIPIYFVLTDYVIM